MKLVLFIMTSIFAGAALACPCARLSPQQAYKKAQYVFVAVAVKETLDGKVRFQIHQRWKGMEAVEEVDLKFTNLERCGVNPTMGLTYLVYARSRNKNQISFDSCSIKEAVNSERDLDFLKTLSNGAPLSSEAPPQ